MSLLALQEYANEFDREGQREKAVQIHMVLLKQLAKMEAVAPPPEQSYEENSASEAKLRSMTDEQLLAGMKEIEPDTGS